MKTTEEWEAFELTDCGNVDSGHARNICSVPLRSEQVCHDS